MRQAWRMIAGLFAIGLLATGGSVALADSGNHGNRDNNGNRGNARATTIFSMPATPDGNPEGVAFDKRSGRFFVSRVGTGAIFSGTLSAAALTPFITPNPAIAGTPPLATGLKVRKGLLYVAGASTGEIRVYNLAAPTAAPVVFKTGGGFINDLDLDEHGNVFATDSTKSFVYMVSAAAVKAGGPPTAVVPIDLSGSIVSTPNTFGLNGILVNHDGDGFTVVQSNTGKLFQVAIGDNNDHHARAAQATPAAPKVTEITIKGGDGNVRNGDGLLKDRGRLLVVRGSAPNFANGVIDVLKLSRHGTRARVESRVTDPSFSGPSTIARAKNRLLVVNASFNAGPTPAGTFTVTGLARNAVRHGGGGHGH
jgi:sugar lactone lactonase YvrE